VSYEVIVTDEAKQDFRDLATEDHDAAREAVRLALELKEDPYIGAELRDRAGVGNLSDCRSIHFDRPNWGGKHRFRLVYRNEPNDGAPAIVAVLAIGDREKLGAYRDAARRLVARAREQVTNDPRD
jgi:ParE-like toxin of type II ParDE toxin-antitoxin system